MCSRNTSDGSLPPKSSPSCSHAWFSKWRSIAVEVEGDPADAALGQRDLEVGELRAASGPNSRSCAVIALIWQASTMRWSTGASGGRWMTSKPAPMCSDSTMFSSQIALSIGSQ